MTLEEIRQDLISDGKEVTSEWLILLTICAMACPTSGRLESTRAVIGERCGQLTGKSYSAKTVERVGEYLSETYGWYIQEGVLDHGYIKKLIIQVPTTFVQTSINICLRRAVDMCRSICLPREVKNNSTYLDREVVSDVVKLSQELGDDGSGNRDKSLSVPSSQLVPEKNAKLLARLNSYLGFSFPASGFISLLGITTAKKLNQAITYSHTRSIAWVPAETKNLKGKRAFVFLSYLFSFVTNMGTKIWKINRGEAYHCEKCGHYAEYQGESPDASNKAGAHKPPRSGQKSREEAQISSGRHSGKRSRLADQHAEEDKGLIGDTFADKIERRSKQDA